MAKINGKGSIIALEEPESKCRKWQLRVSIGRNYITKKYVTKTRRFEGTKTEAHREMRAFINELESGIRTDSQNLTFGEFAESWRQERLLSGELQAGTLRKDDYHTRSLSKHIGNVRLLDINAETVASLYIALRNGGSLSGKPLTGTSVHNIAITLNHVLTEAVNRDIILKNPCDKVKMPTVDTPEKEALTQEEAKRAIRLLTEGRPDARRVGALLGITYGLRRGEVLGLRWGDFDQREGVLSITRSLASDSKELKSTKSKASKRNIPLDSETARYLSGWKAVQGAELLAKGISQGASRPIVASEEGGLIHPENFSRWWRKWRDRNGLHGISFHQLRHTFATIMVASGIDLVTGKALMGHSDTKMLAELYAHVVPENVSRATEKIGGILYGKEETASIIEFEAKSGIA